eukprot:sb/3478983/
MMCHSSFDLHHCIFCERFSSAIAVLEIRLLVSRYLLFLLVPQFKHIIYLSICAFPYSLYSPLCITWDNAIAPLSHLWHIITCELVNLSHSRRSCDK